LSRVAGKVARETRALRFARGAAVVGLGYLAVAVLFVKGPETSWALVLLGISAGALGFLAFLKAEPRFVSVGILLALSAMSVVFLTLHGAGPASGVFLFALPAAASTLVRARWAKAACVGVGLAFATALGLGLAGDNPWFLTTTTFLALLLVVGLLLGSVLRDFNRVFSEHEEAVSGLAAAGRLRVAAEEARDRALLLRNESRSVEALGVVAGSVVHDLNNMAQVIRTWTHEILRDERPGMAHDAAEAIAAACDRVTTLAGDVLAIGQSETDSSVRVILPDAMPKAARALRRYVPESIRLVVDTELPQELPQVPLTGADIVHLVLEGATTLNVAATTSGTLLLSAPRAIEVDIPPPHPGMTRYPVALALELRRDGRGRSATRAGAAREGLIVPDEGKDVLCTSEACVLLFAPAVDVVVMVIDMFPSLATDGPASTVPSIPSSATPRALRG